jgi:hypothetical protein
VEFRTFVALAATMACAAVAAHATSAGQTAREQQPAPLPIRVEDPAAAVPESPLEIAGPLSSDEAAIQIQLGTEESAPRNASLLAVPFDVSSQ